ncbi:zinc finger protein 862-like [Parasteatoda tepidariorum]|uniref:zinc finger protein 862-like n=1 Tax=Parasteatoda tepidariorum TaxID=114398 RepID=UPI0039BD3474
MKEKVLLDVKGTNDISEVKYSVIVDESTDVSIKSNIAIVIKYYSEVDEIVKTKLLNLVEIKDKTAEGLFNSLSTEIRKNGLQLQNLVGFAADTTNVMFGEHNSVVQKLRNESPDCMFIKCVCHSTALAVSKACLKFPRDIEDLIRDTHNYFSYSSKRREEFKEFQDFTNTPTHNILKLYDIRWLSLGQCVDRILEQWDALLLYFTEQHLSERLMAAERLYGLYMNPYKKIISLLY